MGVPGDQSGYFHQNQSVPTPRLDIQNMNIDPRSLAQVPGDQSGYFRQNQSVPTPLLDIQNMSIDPRSPAQVPGDQSGYFRQNQPVPTPRLDIQNMSIDPRSPAQVPGDQSGYFRQNQPVPTPRLDIQNLNIEPRSPAQVPGNQSGYFCQDQPVPAPRSDVQSLNTDSRSLTQVPGKFTQGFASLNIESFGSNANQTSQASLNCGVPQHNFNSNALTSLVATSAEQRLNQLSRILGVSGLSLPNGYPQVRSTVTSVQPQMQTSVIQTVPTPNFIQNQNVSNNPGRPSATPNTLNVLEQGKTKILEPDSFDGS